MMVRVSDAFFSGIVEVCSKIVRVRDKVEGTRDKAQDYKEQGTRLQGTR